MTTLADFPEAFLTVNAVLLGLIFGSFLNVVIHRLPRGESLAYPPSRCPGCGARIRPLDNLPVLGWLLLRGRARCCKARISPRYPLVEACGGLMAWAILRVLVLTLPGSTSIWLALANFALHLALGLGLLAAAFIDLEHMYLPDELTLGGAALGLLSIPLRNEVGWREALFGLVFGFLVVWLPFDVLYARLRGVAGMGLGDAKLVALAGAWFGWRGALFSLLGGAVQATLIVLVLLLVRGRIEEPPAVQAERERMKLALAEAPAEERAELERELALDPLGREPEAGLGKARLAFGPFLSLAVIEYMLFGDAITRLLLGT